MMVVVVGTMYSLSMPWLDTGSRAYILAVYSDLYPAIICPSAILYGAPSIRRKILQTIRYNNNWDNI